MALNTGWIFCCSEADYPKFLALFPENFPPSYREFVALVDQRIKNREEQLTILKAYVGFDEFLAFCASEGHKPNYEALDVCSFRAWGKLPNA